MDDVVDQKPFRHGRSFLAAAVLVMLATLGFEKLIVERTERFNAVRDIGVHLEEVRTAASEYTAYFAIYSNRSGLYSDAQIRRAAELMVGSTARVRGHADKALEMLNAARAPEEVIDHFDNPYDSVLTGVQFIAALTERVQSPVALSANDVATGTNYLAYRFTGNLNAAGDALRDMEDEIVKQNTLIAIGIMSGTLLLIGAGFVLAWRPRYAAMKAQQQRLAARSRTDTMTGFLNAASFHAELAAKLAEPRSSDAKDMLILFEFRGYGDVESVHGLDVADGIMKQAAVHACSVIPVELLIGRVQRAVFALHIRDSGKLEASVALVKRLQTALNQSCEIQGLSLKPEFVFAVAGAPDHGSTPRELSNAARYALLEALQVNGAPVRPFSTESLDLISRRNKIVSALLKEDFSAISIVFQPIYRCADGMMTGVEALARWTDPEFGEVATGEFLPLANSTGKMPALGQELRRQAIEGFAPFRRKSRGDLRLSLNMFCSELPSLRNGSLDVLLEDNGLLWADVTLEVVNDLRNDTLTNECTRTLAEAKGKGARISLDDFGSGNNPFGALQKLDADEIKIARDILGQVSSDPKVKAIVETHLRLASALGLNSVAKGVQNKADIALLQQFGCHEMQGYLFGEPVNALTLLGLSPEVPVFRFSPASRSA